MRNNHECTMCGLEFEGESCRSKCPVSFGCNKVMCPRCGFEFVDESAVVNLFRTVAKFWRTHDSSPR